MYWRYTMSKDIYTHKHHIIPKHMGGTDDPSNIIELTVAEHAEAHKKLYEEHNKLEDKLAWKMLAGRIGKDEFMRARSILGGTKSSTKNIPKTKEHREKISKAKTGVARPYLLGKNHPMYNSEEQRARANKLNNTILTCPKCGHVGKNVGNMKRWHFDNCRRSFEAGV